jgi:eukaryotic-like serine/threonine-protein kinase
MNSSKEPENNVQSNNLSQDDQPGGRVGNEEVTLEPTHSSSAAQAGAPLHGSVGPYHLIRKLGQGGMGQVWLAEQPAPLRRQVALKLIKAGLFDDSLLDRFQAERQSLAIMNHPAIAKVFDAGATPEGQPYFAMEYVQGLPITDYCDQKRLKIADRLELFIKVCEGVQHAHQKAIIHRDLKPANILVVEVDGKPTPRIIDFGIAKAVSSKTTPDAFLTQFSGGFVGTLGYVSPEQANPAVEDVDTRTDVYSLGVILYVLLTGCLPFDSARWKQTPLPEVLRQLREEDAPRPSAKVYSTYETNKRTAKLRRTEPEELVSLLRGDLDWITMKAIEKDRDRRYATPSELSADIERFLQNRPVEARPASAAYRARKYVRRHGVAVGVACGLVAVLAAFAITEAIQVRRITRERDRADREAAAAKNVSDFLTGLFRVSDPSQARGNSITAREILDKGRAQIETRLATQPELQARLMQTMGEVYWSLGLYSEAQPLIEKALESRRRLLGSEHPDTLESMDFLGRTLEREGHYPEAEKLTRETFDIRRRVLGPEHPDTIASMHGMANIALDEGHYSEAEKLYREVLEIIRRVRGPEHPDTLRTMATLALALSDEGRWQEAEKSYREILDVQRRVLGPEHPDTLVTMTSLARMLSNQGNFADAQKLLLDTLDAKRRVLGPEHSETLWSMYDLAVNFRESGHPLEAEKLERETLDIRSRVLGTEHPETLMSMVDLAEDLDDLHRYPEAEKLYRQTLEIQRRILGPDHPETAGTKYNLACNLALSGHREEAMAVLRDAMDHGLGRRDALGLAQDSDLHSLHGDPRFAAIVADAKKRFTPAAQTPQ